MDEKVAELNRFCDAVMGKPKPAPPRPPPKTDTPSAPTGPGMCVACFASMFVYQVRARARGKAT